MMKGRIITLYLNKKIDNYANSFVIRLFLLVFFTFFFFYIHSFIREFENITGNLVWNNKNLYNHIELIIHYIGCCFILFAISILLFNILVPEYSIRNILLFTITNLFSYLLIINLYLFLFYHDYSIYYDKIVMYRYYLLASKNYSILIILMHIIFGFSLIKPSKKLYFTRFTEVLMYSTISTSIILIVIIVLFIIITLINLFSGFSQFNLVGYFIAGLITFRIGILYIFLFCFYLFHKEFKKWNIIIFFILSIVFIIFFREKHLMNKDISYPNPTDCIIYNYFWIEDHEKGYDTVVF